MVSDSVINQDNEEKVIRMLLLGIPLCIGFHVFESIQTHMTIYRIFRKSNHIYLIDEGRDTVRFIISRGSTVKSTKSLEGNKIGHVELLLQSTKIYH